MAVRGVWSCRSLLCPCASQAAADRAAWRGWINVAVVETPRWISSPDGEAVPRQRRLADLYGNSIALDVEGVDVGGNYAGLLRSAWPCRAFSFVHDAQAVAPPSRKVRGPQKPSNGLLRTCRLSTAASNEGSRGESMCARRATPVQGLDGRRSFVRGGGAEIQGQLHRPVLLVPTLLPPSTSRLSESG